MNDENKKSLDERIKEADLAKLKAETADVEKHSKQFRVMGVPLVQIIFGGIVVGFILLSYIQPIVTLDTDLASKKSEYDKIISWIRQGRLDSVNTTLIKERTSLIKERIRQDSTNIALNKKTADLELKNQNAKNKLVDMQWEQRKRQSEIDSLNKRLNEAKISIRTLDASKELERKFNNTFPEFKQAVKFAEVPVPGLPNFSIKYILIPIRFLELFYINKQNADTYMKQRDRLIMLDSLQTEYINLQMENIALQDSILSLRGQNR